MRESLIHATEPNAGRLEGGFLSVLSAHHFSQVTCPLPTPPLHFLDTLALVLATVARAHPAPSRIKEGLTQSLTPAQIKGVADEVAGILLTALLVEQGTLPWARLETLRLQLLGPNARRQQCLVPSAFCHALIPYVMRPVLGSSTAAASARQEWILALLDYLAVDPHFARPLVVLVFLLLTTTSTTRKSPGGALRPPIQFPETVHAALQRAENDVAAGGPAATAEDWWLVESVPDHAAAALLSDDDDDGEFAVQVLSRAVKILHTLSSGARGQNRLVAHLQALPEQGAWDVHWVLLRGLVMGATKGCGGDSFGLLRRLPPTVKRFVAEWCVVAGIGR